MPVKPGYLALAGAGAVVAYSGIKGKGIGSAFRNVIAGSTPARAVPANLITGANVFQSGIGNVSQAVGGMVNPFSQVHGLSAGRIDMGVDFGGTGTIVAIGSGRITAIFNAGWPLQNFICIRFKGGPFSGKYWYTAEDATPLVSPGQFVNAGDPIAIMGQYGKSIEVGWAAPPGLGGTMAALSFQYPYDGRTTAYGASANRLLTALGVPSGHANNRPTGRIAKGYP